MAKATAEETQVAVHEESSIVQAEPQGISGEADPSDFVIPFVKLVQATSETGTAGKFLSSNGDEREHIDMVVLHIQRTRTFYDGDAGKLVCSSNDRRTGIPREGQENIVADDAQAGVPFACGTCPHANDDPFSKIACKPDYALTCFDLDTEEPFLFRVKGSAMGVFRYRLISAVARAKKPPWFASFQMTAVKKSNERKQSWYAPELQPTETFEAEKRAVWGDYAQQFAVRPVHVVDEDDLPFE